MSQSKHSGVSRSVGVYGLLLELYPRPYLRRHRAEILQNLQDLEQTSTSKAELWLFLVRDLVESLRSQVTKSLWGQTAIVVLVLLILLVYTEGHALARLPPMKGYCFGYILGWFAGWRGEGWQASSVSGTPSYLRSLPVQAMILAAALVIVIAMAAVVFGIQGHITWALCYGFLLAWIAGRLGNRWQRRL
jgi:hypothetical protein